MTPEPAHQPTRPGRVLLRGGTVYSDADRFATAMLVEDGVIAWIGDASGVAPRTAGAAVLDLEGHLVTPGFADAGEPPGSPTDLARVGIVARVPRVAGATFVTVDDAGGPAPPPDLHGVAVVDPRALPLGTDLAGWASAGTPLALGTTPGAETDPWDLLRHALARGLSARAAFLAHTRGAWRAGGLGSPRDGSPARLEVGAPATFVVWEETELVTQVADTGRSPWSVDARAGLPPLPRLGALDEAGWRGPAPRLTVVAGRALFVDESVTESAEPFLIADNPPTPDTPGA